jgi:ribosome-binding ATPase YchF (GTP1/OBG family)
MRFLSHASREDEADVVRGLMLLTMKPMIYAANVAETDLADGGQGNPHVGAIKVKAAAENCEVVVVSAQVWPVQLVFLVAFLCMNIALSSTKYGGS